MEERESLPRREALMGVGLLGVLMLGLVGTIVIRIVHAKPRRGAASLAETWASQSPAPTSVAASPTDATTIAPDDDTPTATPIPTLDANERGVAPASIAEPAEGRDENWESAPIAPHRPEFVTPRGVSRD